MDGVVADLVRGKRNRVCLGDEQPITEVDDGRVLPEPWTDQYAWIGRPRVFVEQIVEKPQGKFACG